jgi:hypothetical protein
MNPTLIIWRMLGESSTVRIVAIAICPRSVGKIDGPSPRWRRPRAETCCEGSAKSRLEQSDAPGGSPSSLSRAEAELRSHQPCRRSSSQSPACPGAGTHRGRDRKHCESPRCCNPREAAVTNLNLSNYPSTCALFFDEMRALRGANCINSSARAVITQRQSSKTYRRIPYISGGRRQTLLSRARFSCNRRGQPQFETGVLVKAPRPKPIASHLVKCPGGNTHASYRGQSYLTPCIASSRLASAMQSRSSRYSVPIKRCRLGFPVSKQFEIFLPTRRTDQ